MSSKGHCHSTTPVTEIARRVHAVESASRHVCIRRPVRGVVQRQQLASKGRMTGMSKIHILVITVIATGLPGISGSSSDQRVFVELPEMMQQHLLSNMRDHLAALNEILAYLGNGELDKAAETAEYRLGMSSLESHGAAHMARFMPEGMRQAGTAMHKAASRFALKAEEGDVLPAYRALSDITSACVACHSGYRIK